MNFKRLILRHGTLDEMKALGYPVLLKGEPFVEIDNTTLKLKIGDGASKYDELKYVSSGYSSAVPSGGGSGTGSYIEHSFDFNEGSTDAEKDAAIQDFLTENMANPVVGASYVCLKDGSSSTNKYYWLYYVEDVETVDGVVTLVRKWKDKPQYMLHNVFNSKTDFDNYIEKMKSAIVDGQNPIFVNKIIAVNRETGWDIAICEKTSTPNGETAINTVWFNEINSNNIKSEYITKITNFLIDMDLTTEGSTIDNLDKIKQNLETGIYYYESDVNAPINIGDYVDTLSFNSSLNSLDIAIEDSNLGGGIDNTYADDIITKTLSVGRYAYVQVTLTSDTYEQNKYYVKNSNGEYVLSAFFSDNKRYYEKRDISLDYTEKLVINSASFEGDHVSLLVYLRKIMSEMIRILSKNDQILADDLYKKYIMTTTMLVEYAKRLNNYTERLNALETTVTTTLNNINTSLDNILNGTWQSSNS